MNVIQTIINVFKIKELRDKILFTLAMLAVYRIGFWIPLPGVNQATLADYFERSLAEGNAASRIANFVSVFSGGALGQSTIFGLGVMPYISASIILQILGTVLEPIKRLREEGPTGQQKIQEWTRYLTIVLCIVQGIGWLSFIRGQFVYPEWAGNPLWWVMAITAMTAGTVFLMWIGEQIDRFGIGNGVSMIIMAGILTGMPGAILKVYQSFEPGDPTKLGWLGLAAIIGGFVLVIAGSVIMTVAQRRIPVQQAKHMKGRKVFGGQRSYLPLRVNHGGVMPIIFASSLMIIPSTVFSGVNDTLQNQNLAQGTEPGFISGLFRWMSDALAQGQFPYVLLFIAMVFFFSYFWITVQFNPEEMSKQLRDHGSFIPGLRPGPRTAEYLETVMERVTYVGAAFLAVIAVLPMVVQTALRIDYSVSQFLGGTGLLIVVSVTLDFLQRVEANLLMRNYAGFLGGQDDGKGPKLRGSRY